MSKRWPQTAYIGLYSGAGRARVTKPREIVETTAMGVFRLRHPFTKYIFVDKDPDCIKSLKTRISTVEGNHDVTYLVGDTAVLATQVREALPSYSSTNGLLSFCFVDPFSANLKFDTLRELSRHRMDFLILLMIGRDIRTNLQTYLTDDGSTRIADLIDCPGWREEYAASKDRNIVRFVLNKFDEAMVRVGYLSGEEHLRHQIAAAGTSVLQYVLVFYSRNGLGQKFWHDIRGVATSQTILDLR